MKKLLFIFVITILSLKAQCQWYPSATGNVGIPNNIEWLKHTQKIISGSIIDPQSASVSAGAGSVLMKTDGNVYVKKDGGLTVNWKKFLDESYNISTLIPTASSTQTGLLSSSDWSIFNGKQNALGYTPENQANKGISNGYASLDASGLVPITQIPPAALERMVVVANQAARYALTIATVQNGDTVKQSDTGEMWFVKDETNLGNSDGYAVYTAGTASSVAWSGITGVPTASSSASGILSSLDWTTFNGKQNSLGFTPEDVANKSTNTSLGASDTLYPSQNAVKSYVDAQVKDIVGSSPIVITQDVNTATISVDLSSKEDTSNKSTTTTLGGSDVLFPTQNAVKTYVDTAISGIPQQKTLIGDAPISVTSDAVTSTITLDQSDFVHKGIEETISASKTFSAYINIGDPTVDGSYRFYKSGGALIYQKRVSGSWLETYRVE